MADQDSTGSELAVITATQLPEQPATRPVPGRIVEQVQQGLSHADAALRALQEEPEAQAWDYEIDMRSAVGCSGETPAEALTRAAAWCNKTPAADIVAIGWAHTANPYDGDEYRVTLILAYPEEEHY